MVMEYVMSAMIRFPRGWMNSAILYGRPASETSDCQHCMYSGIIRKAVAWSLETRVRGHKDTWNTWQGGSPQGYTAENIDCSASVEFVFDLYKGSRSTPDRNFNPSNQTCHRWLSVMSWLCLIPSITDIDHVKRLEGTTDSFLPSKDRYEAGIPESRKSCWLEFT